jgi:glycosyltransferase involved in cell wall biosynthesis
MTLAPTISSSDAVRSLEAGALDGLTILRYAHAYESGGGVEQYLYDLNRTLGERNRCTIIQVQLTTSRERAAETEERVGTARVIKVPLLVQERATGGVEKSSALTTAKNFIRDRMLFVPGIFHVITKPLLRDRPVPRRAGEPENTGNRITELAIRFRVNLIVLHTCGGADVSEILDVAEARNIPVALVHHFSNDRLRHFSVRQQTMHARAIGGVSDVDVPHHLAERFCSLSDGIDVDFFRREQARWIAEAPPEPILFLPARLTRSKGQLDVLAVAARLKERSLPVAVVFAGRVDSSEFQKELLAAADARGIRKQLFFVGQLDAARLRDWYAAARVLVFPTRHHEGLPRILMESQAMGLPSVSYGSGGVSGAVREGETGFVVEPGDIAQMTALVENLLRDSNLHRAVALRARQFAEQHFSLRALVERHERFYLQALGQTRNGSGSC